MVAKRTVNHKKVELQYYRYSVHTNTSVDDTIDDALWYLTIWFSNSESILVSHNNFLFVVRLATVAATARVVTTRSHIRSLRRLHRLLVRDGRNHTQRTSPFNQTRSGAGSRRFAVVVVVLCCLFHVDLENILAVFAHG